MRRAVLIMTLAACLCPRGGFTSGATVVTQTGKYHSVSLSTPRKSFQVNPQTGRSSEQEYHAEEKLRFEKIFKQVSPRIEENILAVRREFESRAGIVAYEARHPYLHESKLNREEPPPQGPVRMSFAILFPEMGSVELSFKTPPTRETYDEIARRIQALFSMERMNLP